MNGLEAVVAVADETLSREITHRDPESVGLKGICVDGMNMSDQWILESIDWAPVLQVGVDSPDPNRNSSRIHEVLAEVDIPVGVLGKSAIHHAVAFDLEERDWGA
jgi:hypothetical protein